VHRKAGRVQAARVLHQHNVGAARQRCPRQNANGLSLFHDPFERVAGQRFAHKSERHDLSRYEVGRPHREAVYRRAMPVRQVHVRDDIGRQYSPLRARQRHKLALARRGKLCPHGGQCVGKQERTLLLRMVDPGRHRSAPARATASIAV
jgi:hypothetical protein